jgi:hypothetical protein
MRLGKDGEAIPEMLACKSPAHAAAVQSRWIEQTLRDDGAEMSKLVSLCSKSMNLGSRADD